MTIIRETNIKVKIKGMLRNKRRRNTRKHHNKCILKEDKINELKIW